jgi:hypothetical protein
VGNWNSIAQEIQQEAQAAANRSPKPGSPGPFDIVRRRKLAEVARITGRPVVLYAVDVFPVHPLKAQFTDTQLTLTDKDGFDEVTRNVKGPAVDVVLHTPGGVAEATESIVALLRARFDSVRFIIPNFAKSAGTMLAMSGDQIVMDERSELGPTDPQMMFVQGQRPVVSPAHAIKEQFEQAQRDINGNPSRLPGWVPILQQYGPSLLAECDNHIELSEVLVRTWLQQYMFATDPNGAQKAELVAKQLADLKGFYSHSRRIGIDDLKKLGVNVLDMRDQPELRDAVWDVYLATSETFASTGVFKIFENSQNEALLRMISFEAVPNPEPPQTPSLQRPNKPNKPQGKQPLLPRGRRT